MTSKQVKAHGGSHVHMLSAVVLLCVLCEAIPLGAAGPRPAPAANGAATRPVRPPRGPETPALSEPGQAGHLTQELWSSRITAPDPNEDAETRLALQRLIQQVRSVRFGNEAAVPPAALPLTARAVPALPKSEPVAAPAVKPPETVTVAVPPAGAGASPVSGQEKALAGLLQDTRRTSDPLEIAELLFLSGRPADAAPFYAQALERLPAGDATTAADRAWTLFQLANCLREANAGEAQGAYAKLISEYPDSPWTELARAQSQLLSWYQKDRPQQLAASRRP
jgi:tetratricopeptide (TPR) repeat protein